MLRAAVSIVFVALSALAAVRAGEPDRAENTTPAPLAASTATKVETPKVVEVAPAAAGSQAPATETAVAPTAAPIEIMVPRVPPKVFVTKPAAAGPRAAAKPEEPKTKNDAKPAKTAEKAADKPPVKSKPKTVSENDKGGKKVSRD
jgi:hypothetical protein